MQLVRVATMIAIAIVASSAYAGDPKQEAAAHVQKAMKLFSDGKAAEAVDELKTAYALDPKPEMLFALGQAYARMGQCDQAATFYERFLATRPDADAADITRQAMAACKPSDPKLAELAAHLDKAKTLTAAGQHREATVELEAAYTIEPRPEILLALGDANSKLADCTKVRGYYERYLQTKPDDAQAKQGLAACAPKARQERWYHDKLGVALAGGGALLITVGLVEYGAARSERKKADDEMIFEDYVDRIDSAKSKRTLAVVLGVAGTAALGAGVFHIMRHRGRAAEVQLTPTAGGAAVSLTGRF